MSGWERYLLLALGLAALSAFQIWALVGGQIVVFRRPRSTQQSTGVPPDA